MTRPPNKYIRGICLLCLMIANPLPFVHAKPMGSLEQTSNSVNSLMEDKIEAFKQGILNRLGYDKVPDMSNVTQSIEEKRRMIQQYRRYLAERQEVHRLGDEEEEDEEEDSRINTKRFYTFDLKDGESHVTIDSSMPKAYKVAFSVPLKHPADDANQEVHVHSATLRLFKASVEPQNLKDRFSLGRQLRLNVYQILASRTSANASGGYRRKLLDSRLVGLQVPGWETFQVTSAVQDWINDEDSNLGLEISSDSQDIHDVLSFDLKSPDGEGLSDNSTEPTAPTIHLYTQERSILKRVKRRGRRRGECKPGDKESRCCRYPITISFRDIGWDNWILAPASYEGYYCAGSCPYSYRMANTFAGIKALLHMKNPDTVPAPCCVATKLSPFTILHYDRDGGYAFSDYPDLVVGQCRCG